MKAFYICLTFFLINIKISSQSIQDNLIKSHFSTYISQFSIDEESHNSFLPLINLDTIKNRKSISVNRKNWLYKKIFLENLLILEGEKYKLLSSPIFDLTLGKDFSHNKNTFTNTRGYVLYGSLGKKIKIFSLFKENQAVFPNYLNEFILSNKVVPGQGYARNFGQDGFDYSMSSGHLTYNINKMFSIQFGHGKHFIGQGYRSLLLSDNSFNYPFLRVQTKLRNIQYTNLYAEFQDLRYFTNNNLPDTDQLGYPKKYMSSHYLSYNFNSKFNISLYESVIWRMNHAPGVSGFDINYLNPIVFFRPIEFSINSPDNVLLGLNSSYLIANSAMIYAQIVLDEFSLNDLRKNNGFWANKYGYQIGCKSSDIYNIKNLYFQAEFNLVRPYTYAHHNPQQNYAHYNQPLAHPLGANFSELLFILNYKKSKWEFSSKFTIAKYGGSFINDSISYGNDVYQSTGQFIEPNGFSYAGRPSDFGIKMYQGNYTTVNTRMLSIAYILNPLTNLKINFQIINRDFTDEQSKMTTNFFNFGLKSDLFNYYYDF